MMPDIKIHTDGSCNIHHPKRPGGWAYHIEYTDPNTEEQCTDNNCGGTTGTSNNQMELMAILNAIKRVTDLGLTGGVIIYSDSEWAVRCLTGVYNCKARVVRQYLDEIKWATGSLTVKYVHIPGHAGILENELVNDKAQEVMRVTEAILANTEFVKKLEKHGGKIK